ncbi:MAG: S8 family peptidase [Bacillota bacterium]
MRDYTFLVALLLLIATLSLPDKDNKPRKNKPYRRILYTEDELSMDDCCKRANSIGIKVVKELPFIGGMVCEMEDGQDAKLLTLDRTLKIEEDIKVYATCSNFTKGAVPSGAIPTDSITLTGAPQIWQRSTGKGVSVAVIDTGIAKHQDLNVLSGISTLGETHTDNYLDDNGHGTHVAGIIAASGKNQGLLGMAPNVDLYAVKALDKYGSGYVSDIIEGIAWAVENDMDIANLSLGTSETSEALRRAVRRAAMSSTILVAASGNSGLTSNPGVLYPAKYPEVLSVGSVNSNGTFSTFTSYGPELDMLAYGENILSTYLGNSYRRESGTSMAAPQVSGALALLLGLRYRSSDAVKALLNSTKRLNLPAEKQGRGLISLIPFVHSY